MPAGTEGGRPQNSNQAVGETALPNDSKAEKPPNALPVSSMLKRSPIRLSRPQNSKGLSPCRRRGILTCAGTPAAGRTPTRDLFSSGDLCHHARAPRTQTILEPRGAACKLAFHGADPQGKTNLANLDITFLQVYVQVAPEDGHRALIPEDV